MEEGDMGSMCWEEEENSLGGDLHCLPPATMGEGMWDLGRDIPACNKTVLAQHL